MKTKILYDKRHGACLFNSETRQAFGPLFADEETARAFLSWCPADPAEISVQFFSALVNGFRERVVSDAAESALSENFAGDMPRGPRRLTAS